MTSFINYRNKYTLDGVDTQNNLISVYIDEQFVVYKYDGDIRFYIDGNGAGKAAKDTVKKAGEKAKDAVKKAGKAFKEDAKKMVEDTINRTVS